MWGYQCYFSSFTSNSSGVAILFNNNFDFKVHKEKGDKDVNYHILKVCIEGHMVVLCTIYGPNMDSPNFYENIQQSIEEMNCNNIIWCGDFNLVLNPQLDSYNYKSINNPKAKDKVEENMDEYT